MSDFALRMPAEWEPHEAIWLAWPHHREDWPDRFEPIPWVFVEMIRLMTTCVRVRLVVRNVRERAKAVRALERSGVDPFRVDLFPLPTERVWLRDSGPIFVYRGAERVLLDWRFNAWAKYEDWRQDNRLPYRISRLLDLPRLQPHREVAGETRWTVLEGGSIDVNGQGTLLTTEECLLSDVQCRNPGFTRADYEATFAEYFGVSNVIWLGKGIAGDDTHGHVDDLARFVNPTTVVLVTETDPQDDNYAALRDNRNRLLAARDQAGHPLTVVELPMPGPVVFDGQRLPASYANFLITNRLVLVPTFNDPNDRIALNILSDCFPDRSVVGIHCGELIWGLGAIHCASQQEIALVPSPTDSDGSDG
ncbi:MAG: agmatine deiminase family protein [Capsulimonadales bacterium]|nr:agmatine deiminase family protein [Capsulimonadales bacterium]